MRCESSPENTLPKKNIIKFFRLKLFIRFNTFRWLFQPAHTHTRTSTYFMLAQCFDAAPNNSRKSAKQFVRTTFVSKSYFARCVLKFMQKIINFWCKEQHIGIPKNIRLHSVRRSMSFLGTPNAIRHKSSFRISLVTCARATQPDTEKIEIDVQE